MATKFLRKIILEELQEVLKEQAGLEVFKSRKPTETPYTGVDDVPYTPDQTSGTSSPFFRGKSSVKPKPILTPQQKYKREVKNLQKELVRIGTPGVKVNGDIEDLSTYDGIMMLYPGIEFKKATDTKEKIQRLTNFISKKPSGFYNVALQNRFEDSDQKSVSASPSTSASSSASVPPLTSVPAGIQKRSEEEDEPVLKAAEEIGPKREDMEESITREIRKLLRSI